MKLTECIKWNLGYTVPQKFPHTGVFFCMLSFGFHKFAIQYSSTFHTPLKRPILAKKGMILESSKPGSRLVQNKELDLVPHLGSK